jgi:hypothetical protein
VLSDGTLLEKESRRSVSSLQQWFQLVDEYCSPKLQGTVLIYLRSFDTSFPR